jgi:hypothetical protein
MADDTRPLTFFTRRLGLGILDWLSSIGPSASGGASLG